MTLLEAPGLTISPSATAAQIKDSDVNFFPDLPPYTDPTSGLVAKLPSAWIPYAQLMRLDRPAGFYAFYFPHLVGLAYAACIAPSAPDPSKLAWLAVWLIPYNILLRGIACTWNDTVDQRFDRRVRRCRHRPVARGAVSTWQAHSFALAQLLLGLFPLLRWRGGGGPFPHACTLQALINLALLTVYALLKRVTYYPQVFLGVAFAWAVPFCVAALSSGEPDDLLLNGGGLWVSTAALCGANAVDGHLRHNLRAPGRRG